MVSRFLLLLILFLSPYANACMDILSPSNWKISKSTGNPLFVTAYATCNNPISLVLEYKKMEGETFASFELENPAIGTKWLFGSCSIAGKADPAIIAISKTLENPGVTQKLISAYKINIHQKSLIKLNASKVVCYDAGY